MIVLTLALALQATAAASADPLLPAAQGKEQCYHPDVQRHTCRSIARYRRSADGGYQNEAVVLLAPTPVVVMTTITPVQLKDGAVCGAIRNEDIQAAQISVQGTPLSGDGLTTARTRIAGALASVVGHQICTRYVPQGADLSAKAQIDGVDRPELADTVRWVDPKDGYTVAP